VAPKRGLEAADGSGYDGTMEPRQVRPGLRAAPLAALAAAVRRLTRGSPPYVVMDGPGEGDLARALRLARRRRKASGRPQEGKLRPG
jgi:hypothetical protein